MKIIFGFIKNCWSDLKDDFVCFLFETVENQIRLSTVCNFFEEPPKVYPIGASFINAASPLF